MCRTGKCEARDKEACRLAHDPDKVAVCPKWLAGSCTALDCPLQHELRPDLMPLCTFFLKVLPSRLAPLQQHALRILSIGWAR